jgi:hypothetical protein
MEADGLVTHTAAGGRKVYEITDAGRAELTARAAELATLEREIHESVADLSTLASEVEQGVRGSVRDLKRELRQASREARTSAKRTPWSWEPPPAEPAPSELERAAALIVAEARRLARAADADVVRTATGLLDTALGQLRRLRG